MTFELERLDKRDYASDDFRHIEILYMYVPPNVLKIHTFKHFYRYTHTCTLTWGRPGQSAPLKVCHAIVHKSWIDDRQLSAPLTDKTFVLLTPQANFMFPSLLVYRTRNTYWVKQKLPLYPSAGEKRLMTEGIAHHTR